METIFLNILNISISASWLILAVFILRAIFPSTPKWIVCLFWLIVGFRLICPFTIESDLCLIPNNELLIVKDSIPYINTRIESIDSMLLSPFKNNLSGVFYVPGTTTTKFDSLINIVSIVWITGVIIMLLYMIISYINMMKKLRTATLLQDNIYQSEFIKAPFVMGIIKPKIYIPYNVELESIDQIIIHENAHLKRHDNITKVIAFLLLSVYWINPLVWLSFIYLCKDIEYATDEKVIKMMEQEEKQTYAKAILDNSVKDFSVVACPFSFGGGNLLFRIDKIMSYKKPTIIGMIISSILCLFLVVCFSTSYKAASVEDYINYDKLGDVVVLPSAYFSNGYIESCPIDYNFKQDFDYTKIEYECSNGVFSTWSGEYTYSPEYEDALKIYDIGHKMSSSKSQEVDYSPIYESLLSGELCDVIKFKIYNEDIIEYQGTINVYYLNENRCTDYVDRETYAFKLVDCDDLYLQGSDDNDLWFKLKE